MTHPERWTFDWFHNRQKPELKGNNAMNANTLLELAAKWEKAKETLGRTKAKTKAAKKSA
jgi:hypothetical protein